MTKRTRAELMRDVDSHYYGFRDDDDGILVPLEVAEEKEAIGKIYLTYDLYIFILKFSLARLIAEYKGNKAGADDMEEDEDLYIKEIKAKDDEDALKDAMEEGKEARFMARVKVPTQKDIEEALLRRKKQELLEMYAIDSEDLDQLEEQAKSAPAESMETSEAEKEKSETPTDAAAAAN